MALSNGGIIGVDNDSVTSDKTTTFTSSGTFAPAGGNVPFNTLVVAGGGSGGSTPGGDGAGGGGAGPGGRPGAPSQHARG